MLVIVPYCGGVDGDCTGGFCGILSANTMLALVVVTGVL